MPSRGCFFWPLDSRRSTAWRTVLLVGSGLFLAAAYRRDNATWFTLQVVCFLGFGAGWLSSRLDARLTDRARLVIGTLGLVSFVTGFVYFRADKLTDNLGTSGLLGSQVAFVIATAVMFPLAARLPRVGLLQ